MSDIIKAAQVIEGEVYERDPRRSALSVACPFRHCRASVGAWCTTPTGWRTMHTARLDAARGVQRPAAKPRKVRLTDPQAERVECAALNQGRYLVSNYSHSGDASDRASMRSMVDKGVFGLVERGHHDDVYELTGLGWELYRTDPLVIRRCSCGEVCRCGPAPTA